MASVPVIAVCHMIEKPGRKNAFGANQLHINITILTTKLIIYANGLVLMCLQSNHK